MTDTTDSPNSTTPPYGCAWVAKVARPGGGESVIGHGLTKADAQVHADAYNEPYQSDDAFVEPWNATKAAAWPSWTPEKLAEIAAKVGMPRAR
jgi:hypothetical protein